MVFRIGAPKRIKSDHKFRICVTKLRRQFSKTKAKILSHFWLAFGMFGSSWHISISYHPTKVIFYTIVYVALFQRACRHFTNKEIPGIVEHSTGLKSSLNHIRCISRSTYTFKYLCTNCPRKEGIGCLRRWRQRSMAAVARLSERILRHWRSLLIKC